MTARIARLPRSGFPVRCAYTLNGFHPFICTIISDQPFFFYTNDAGDGEDNGDNNHAA